MSGYEITGDCGESQGKTILQDFPVNLNVQH
jgi:hypothetical protein